MMNATLQSVAKQVVTGSRPRRALATLIGAACTYLCAGQALAGDLIYVPNTSENTVSVVDGSSMTIVKTIDVATHPFIAAPLANGKKVYVDDLGLSKTGMSVINTADGSVSKINTSALPPIATVLSPDQSLLYVLEPTSRLDVIDTATDKVVNTFKLQGLSIGLQVSPDGKTFYISFDGGGVEAFDAKTGRSVHPITYFGGVLPAWLSISRDGADLYVLDFFSGTTEVIDTATWKLVTTIDNGGIRSQPAIAIESLDGKKLYITNFVGRNIQVVDKSSWLTVKKIETSGLPLGVVVGTDGMGYYTDWGPKSAKISSFWGSTLLWVELFFGDRFKHLGPGVLVKFDTKTDTVVGEPLTVGLTPNIIDVGPSVAK